MKNATWRRIGYVALAVIIFGVGYFIGKVTGAIDSAKWFIARAVELEIIDGVGKAELMEYFIKLKGGGW